MSLECGIIGLPNVGKSTLFNALTAESVPADNYPFCTVDPHHGIVSLQDERLEQLTLIYKPQKVTPAAVAFTDIAGLVKGSSTGEGLGNQFLGQIKQVNAIVHVIRCFTDDNVTHVDGSVNPVRDIEVVETELLLKDLDTIRKRLETTARQVKSGNPEAVLSYELLKRLEEHCNSGLPAKRFQVTKDETGFIDDLFLLTSKPVLYVANIDEEQAQGKSTGSALETLEEYARSGSITVLSLCAKLEEEISQLDDREQKLFLSEYGLKQTGLKQLAHHAFNILGLKTFFTGNENELRAWTVPRNARAVDAADSVHSDFAKGFIKADIYKISDLIHYGSEKAVREAGHLNQVGRDHLVEDGDCIYFRFNT
jgi:GTP-binding protein YchF